MTKKLLENSELLHWAICRDCAKERGGVETDWPHTVHQGDCEYCGKKDATMVPVRDFKWRKNK